CLDFFVHTPRQPQERRDDGLVKIHADFGGTLQAFHIGPGSVATPGFLPGLFALHDRFGTMPMTRLAEFAIHAAKAGVPVTGFQAKLGRIVEPILTASPEARALHAPDGALHTDGDLLTNPALADALDALASEGVRIGTEGEIAQAMLAAASGGHLTRDDLRSYTPQWRTPLMRTLGLPGGVQRTLALNPAPSAGGGLIAAILATYGTDKGYDALAFATALDRVDRRWREMGKPEGFDDGMLAGPPAAVASRGTTHLSVIDAEGMAVALTVSNGEGNGAIAPGCGFMLNNMLGEDDLLADGPGSWTPDKRLASMMAPTLVASEAGGLLALGSGGSNRIRSAMAQVMIRRLGGGEALEQAIHAPRLHVEAGHLDAEPGLEPEPLQQAFDDRRIWDEPSMFFGGVHGVERVVNRDGRVSIEGAGDDRRDGVFEGV
ncbi:MAG: gamma-glutamyltransferase, partial [Devosiaceae bacterium]|nr:gamma-glutamyltransferase [Devosiaceae bacterium MH13]